MKESQDKENIKMKQDAWQSDSQSALVRRSSKVEAYVRDRSRKVGEMPPPFLNEVLRASCVSEDKSVFYWWMFKFLKSK